MKNPPVNAGDAGDVGWLPLSGRFSGGENGNPPQHSCQENRRGAWWVSAHGAANSRTQLSTHTHTHSDILQSRNYDLFMFVLSVMPDTEKCLSFKKNSVNVY